MSMLAVLALSFSLSRCHVTEKVINSPVGPGCDCQDRHPFTHTHTHTHKIMSPFAPQSSFVPTSLHLIMPIKSTRGGVGVGWGGVGWMIGSGKRRERAVLSHSASLPFSVHVFVIKERSDPNESNNVIAMSAQEMAKPGIFFYSQILS